VYTCVECFSVYTCVECFSVYTCVVASIESSQVSSGVLRLLRCWLRRLSLLCSTSSIYYPLITYNIYIAIGQRHTHTHTHILRLNLSISCFFLIKYFCLTKVVVSYFLTYFFPMNCLSLVIRRTAECVDDVKWQLCSFQCV